MFNTVQNHFHDYYTQLPLNTCPSIFRSALYSFSISFILRGVDSRAIPLTRPLMTAGAASTATLIHALTNPVFNYIFENRGVKWHQETIRFIIDITVTSLLASHVTTIKIQELVFEKTAFWFMSTHAARVGVDLAVGLIGTLDERIATQARNWLGTWGFKFNIEDNPTYIVI